MDFVSAHRNVELQPRLLQLWQQQHSHDRREGRLEKVSFVVVSRASIFVSLMMPSSFASFVLRKDRRGWCQAVTPVAWQRNGEYSMSCCSSGRNLTNFAWLCLLN